MCTDTYVMQIQSTCDFTRITYSRIMPWKEIFSDKIQFSWDWNAFYLPFKPNLISDSKAFSSTLLYILQFLFQFCCSWRWKYFHHFHSHFSCIPQTTEWSAKVLMNAGYNCEVRGPTYIKGKGTMTTYFVKTQFDDRI